MAQFVDKFTLKTILSEEANSNPVVASTYEEESIGPQFFQEILIVLWRVARYFRRNVTTQVLETTCR